MILPRGEIRHQNLLTAYTDFSALLSTLKLEGFSGIIELKFPENKGVIFIGSGEIINAEWNGLNGTTRIIEQEAVHKLINLSSQKDGVLNIYRLAPEQVAIAARHLQHDILYKELSTDFTRLDRLLMKLREDKHNGLIEVLTKEHQAMGVLFLEEGEPMEMFTIPESGPSVFGRKSIPVFVESAVQRGAILNVYRSNKNQGKISKEEEVVRGGEEGLKELLLIFQDILSKAEKLIEGATRRKEIFHKVFKKSLIEKSEKFPFLDPFASEFEYREGMIVLRGEIGSKDLTQGIIEILIAMIVHLNEELPKDKILPLKLKAEIESSLEQYRETLKRLGVDPIVSFIFK